MTYVYAKILHHSMLNAILTAESVGSRESVKYISGDPILGKNFFFPVSSCQSTRTPSFPPEYKHFVIEWSLYIHAVRKLTKEKEYNKKEEDQKEKSKPSPFYLTALKICIPEYKYAPSEEKRRRLIPVGCQCQVVQESASSFPLVPGFSSSSFINPLFTIFSPSENVRLPNPLQIRILPDVSPAATSLFVG